MHGIDILECLRTAGRPLTAREIIEATGISRSTTFRYLQAMVDQGYLFRHPHSKRYLLGSRVLALGSLARSQLASESLIGPPLRELHRSTKETITFSLLDQAARVCVFVLEAKSDLRHVARVGDRYPLHLGAAGKVLLAHLDREQARSILRQAELDAPAELRAVEQQLDRIVADGYAVATDERVTGVTAVAGMVSVDGTPWASVAVAGPTSRMQPIVESTIPKVLVACRRLSDAVSATTGATRKGAAKPSSPDAKERAGWNSST